MTDFYTGRLSVRRLAAFVAQFLADRTSALVRAIDPDTAAWGPTDYILADLFDLFARANWKKPQPYPRPRPGETKRAQVAAAQRRKALQAQIARNEARREAAAHD